MTHVDLSEVRRGVCVQSTESALRAMGEGGCQSAGNVGIVSINWGKVLSHGALVDGKMERIVFGRGLVTLGGEQIRTPTCEEVVERIQAVASDVRDASVRRSLLRAGCELTELAIGRIAQRRFIEQCNAIDR